MASLLSRLNVPHPLKVSEGFHHVVINHFPYIRERGLLKQHPMADIYCSIYQGDFYGMLQHLGVPDASYRLNTEFNGFHSSNDYRGEQILVSIIDEEFIETLFKNFITVKR